MRKIEKIRLNKLVADRSEYSRREADELVQKGFVKVEGEVVTNQAESFDKNADITVRKLMNKIDNFFIVFYFKMIYFWIVRSTPISILSNNATTSSKFVFNKISMILINGVSVSFFK